MTLEGEFLLGDAAPGQSGIITRVGNGDMAGKEAHDTPHEEIEHRLLEMGFVEGAHVEVLHQGFLGKDPIAVKLDMMRVALRRHEAKLVVVTSQGGHH